MGLKNNSIIILLTLLTVSSCRPNLKTRLCDYVEDNGLISALEKGDTVMFDWSRVIGVPIDSVIVIPEWCFEDDISKLISGPYSGPYVKDSHSRFIFFYENSIVYEEDVPWTELCTNGDEIRKYGPVYKIVRWNNKKIIINPAENNHIRQDNNTLESNSISSFR